MKIIHFLFGKRPETRAPKGIFLMALLSMLPNFFNMNWRGLAWMNYSMPLLLLSFFTTGISMTFASKDSLIDYWRPKSGLGRALSDPQRGMMVVRSMRTTGIGVIILIPCVVFPRFILPVEPLRNS